MYIFTHHKCASTWLAWYIKDYARLNGVSVWQSHLSDHFPEEEFAIKIVTNAFYPSIRDRAERGIHVFRNPFNLVVSAYFSHRNTHPLDDWPQLERQRRLLHECDMHDGLWATIGFLERADFHPGAVGPLYGLRQWDFDDRRFLNVRAEDLFRTPDAVGRMLPAGSEGSRLPAAEGYLFESFTGRRVGVVDDGSHYRSGHEDQWRQKLPASVIRYIRTHFAFMSRFYPEAFEDPAESAAPVQLRMAANA